MKNHTPTTEDANKDNSKFADWEEILLDDENQPKLYDPLDVLDLRDNIDKTAKAVIYINIISSIVSFPIIRIWAGGYIPTSSDIVNILITLIITALGTGLTIAITYFPLKALNHILRILMEMEFNSRKGQS